MPKQAMPRHGMTRVIMTHPTIGEEDVELPHNDPLRNSSPGRRWLLAFLVMALPVVAVAWGVWTVVRPIPHPDVVVEIPMGQSVVGIAKALEEKGVVPNHWIFLAYNLIQGDRLKAGEYLFPDGLSLPDVYRKLVK